MDQALLYFTYPGTAGILEHVWGVSAAQDRVWAQVCGVAPSRSGRRFFMVLEAYIDDSYNKDGIFVLAGYIARASAWAQFSKEWEEMLPAGTPNKNGRNHFKMSEMAMSPDRMARVSGFYRIIENHTTAAISCKIDISELRRARERIYVPDVDIDWGFWGNTYKVAFRCLLDMFHTYREKFPHVVPLDEQVDFYFDDQTEKRDILAAWDDYILNRPPEIREFYGATPRFENDKVFLPLQAADFLAWWVRKWYTDGKPECLQDGNFYTWHHKRSGYPHIQISVDENSLVEAIISQLKTILSPDHIIYDRKKGA